MTAQELLATFGNLQMAPAGGGRAVHKPLLVLFWLARLERGEPRLARFVEVEDSFKQLLIEFGSSNSPNTRHLPFWHLCNDADGKIWELRTERGIQIQTMGAPEFDSLSGKIWPDSNKNNDLEAVFPFLCGGTFFVSRV